MNAPTPPTSVVEGLNGVAVTRETVENPEYRSYEVYQRQRPHQSTEKINGRDLISPAYSRDPYPTLAVLRENYPCYRDWVNNAFWVSRYDDVTSIFTDDGNFETRSRAWFYGLDDVEQPPELAIAWAAGLAKHAAPEAASLIEALPASFDLARDVAAVLPKRVALRTLGLAEESYSRFALLIWRLVRGQSWLPSARQDGLAALAELSSWLDDEIKTAASADSPGDLIGLSRDIGLTGSALARFLLEQDHETLHGTIANLWAALLTDPAERAKLDRDPLAAKTAVLETFRHSTPVLSAWRFARHEVERFGQLIPQGALVICSAAAANRDPRVFENPDRFIADRADICHREPRGQYRADGLASGLTVGLGKPTKHPAVPEDRPPSLSALTRDAATAATRALLEQRPGLGLEADARPELYSLSVGEMHTCWQLPVTSEPSP